MRAMGFNICGAGGGRAARCLLLQASLECCVCPGPLDSRPIIMGAGAAMLAQPSYPPHHRHLQSPACTTTHSGRCCWMTCVPAATLVPRRSAGALCCGRPLGPRCCAALCCAARIPRRHTGAEGGECVSARVCVRVYVCARVHTRSCAWPSTRLPPTPRAPHAAHLPHALHAVPLCRRVGEHVSLAANMLAFDSADGLTHDQHLALLRFLCDEALDTEKMRSALQSEHWSTANCFFFSTCCASCVAALLCCGAGHPEDAGGSARKGKTVPACTTHTHTHTIPRRARRRRGRRQARDPEGHGRGAEEAAGD